MVITKKSTKVLPRSTAVAAKKEKKTLKAIWPGRPKKEFLQKHKRIVLSETNKKIEEKITNHTLPKWPKGISGTHKIFNFPNKDKSILYLFIFSVILFIFSIIVSRMKKEEIDNTIVPNDEITTTTPIIEDDSIPTKDNNTITNSITNNQAQTALTNFYQAVNTRSFTLFDSIVDTTLRNSTTFRTYFSVNRLTRFLNSLNEGTIYITNIKEISNSQNPNISNLTYTLQYTLTTDKQTYTEDRSATLIEKWQEYKLAKIKCDTVGCSRMPFFNPGKYDIK